ncbi:MAG: GDSL-type esterase/lipase family protein [Oscillospiraceae bacterium]|nr:GDSL-type esterase/lipase family protein [Oscillospiraceae bacterium]
MQHSHILKKAAALVSAIGLSFTALSAAPVLSVNASADHILILGDSISSGYGLKEGEFGYADYLADVLGGSVTNMAVPGYSTDDLLAQLEKAEVQEAVKNADFISISIGGNDLLKPAQEYFKPMMKEDETIMEAMRRLAKEGDAETMMIGLTRALTPARSKAKVNYPLIQETLRGLNPDATIVMQTVYNPAEVQASFLEAQNLSADTISKYEQLNKYMNNTVNFLNKVVRELEDVKVADVFNDFTGSGWIYTRVYEKDIHPTALGHAMIAASVLNAAGVESGKSNKFVSAALDLMMSDYNQISESNLALMKKYSQDFAAVKGDMDNSGIVDGMDAQMVLSVYCDTVMNKPLDSLITYRQMLSCDIDGDGKFTSLDAQYVLSYYLSNNVLHQPVSWSQLVH